MKKLNNALNEVHDNYIDEAAKADRLVNSKAKTIMNIAIPVAATAAVVGICLGLNGLGVFGGKPQGVDLLPADSGSSSHSSTTQTVPFEDNDFTYPVRQSLPEEIPLALQTKSDIERIIFGSEFPDMLYADEEKAIFTDGVGGVYVFDYAAGKITFAADIFDSLYLSVDEFNYTGEDSWNGVSIFALEDGTVCCSLARSRFDTIFSSHPDYDNAFYVMDTDNLTLTRDDSLQESELPLYEGRFDIPYGEGYGEIGMTGARIGDTDEFVYIRRCTEDIDLAPMYSMQLIELRRWKDGEPTDQIIEHAEGCWFPFDYSVGKEPTIYSKYVTYEADGVTQNYLFLGASEFEFDTWGSVESAPHGKTTVKGDILKLVDEETGYIWLYRIAGNELILLETANQMGLPENSFDPTLYTSKRFVSAMGAVVLTNEPDNSDEDTEELVADMENIKDDLEDEIESIEAMMQANLIRIEELNEHLSVLEKYSGEDNTDYEIIREDIDSITQQINEELEKNDYLQSDIDEIEEKLDSIEMELDMLEIKISSEDMEQNFALYMEEHFDAASIMIEEAPEFCAILDNARGISTYFGYDEWRGGTHYGIDIVADGGAPVYAAADGIAYVVSGEFFYGYGNAVIIQHDGGYFTLYAHADSIHVQDGEKVTAGQHIADVGNTGFSTGYHLHFEVREGAEAVDPMKYFAEFSDSTE